MPFVAATATKHTNRQLHTRQPFLRTCAELVKLAVWQRHVKQPSGQSAAENRHIGSYVRRLFCSTAFRSKCLMFTVRCRSHSTKEERPGTSPFRNVCARPGRRLQAVRRENLATFQRTLSENSVRSPDAANRTCARTVVVHSAGQNAENAARTHARIFCGQLQQQQQQRGSKCWGSVGPTLTTLTALVYVVCFACGVEMRFGVMFVCVGVALCGVCAQQCARGWILGFRLWRLEGA